LLKLIAARVEKNNVIAFPKSYHPRDYEKKGAASASSLVWKDDFVRGEQDDLPRVEVSLEYLDEARLVRLYWRISEDVKPRRYLWSFFKASEDASSNVLEAVHDTTFEVSRKDGGCKVLSFASLGGDPSMLDLRCIVEPITYNGEVDIFDRKRDYKIARQAYEKVLETRREILGNTHPDTLTTMQELARLHQEEGACEDARAMYEEVLASQQEVLGEDHPDILATKQHLTNLADD
jgi:tetratricopeptide (TPR) repeat protein